MNGGDRTETRGIVVNMLVNIIDTKITDEQIRRLIIDCMPLMENGGECAIAIDGFNDDPRELWQIPEVVDICKRLFAMGACSALTISIHFDKRFGALDIAKPYGAFEIWLLATDEWVKNNGFITRQHATTLFQMFVVELAVSNKKAVSISNGFVEDGQHKGSI